MNKKIDYSIYLCTDRELMTSQSIEQCVEAALKGGVTAVQLREKTCNSKDFYQLGLRIKNITSKYGAPLIINDRVDIALAIGADGVHVGQDDLPCLAVRKIVGENMLIGVSATNLAEAIKAEQDGADYIGVGAMFGTNTKTNAKIVTMTELDTIRKAVKIPIVVIGGINKQTLQYFKGKGIDGIAVVSAIVSQPEVEFAASELVQLWKK